MEGVATHGFVAGVQVGRPMFRAPGIAVHAGLDEEDQQVAIVVLQAVATAEQQQCFNNIARFAGISGIDIRKHEEHVILATPEPRGVLSKLPWESWRLPERLQRFRQVAEIVQRFHRENVAVGTLSPNYIAVTEALDPFLLGPRLAPRSGAFVAPETAGERVVDIRSDVFSLGKLLYFVVAKQQPPRESSAVPKLTELCERPAGLVRIIRKATTMNPEARYPSVDALLADLDEYSHPHKVGVTHPEVEEHNLCGLSVKPKKPERAAKPKSQATLQGDRVTKDRRQEPSRFNFATLARSAALALTLAGGAFLLSEHLDSKRGLVALPETEVTDLSFFLVSGSLSETTPPVFFGQVDPSWELLSAARREEELRRVFGKANRRWGSKDALLHRDDAVVAQVWNHEVTLFAGLRGEDE